MPKCHRLLHQCAGNSAHRDMWRLTWTTIISYLWREQNSRVHGGGESRSPITLLKTIKTEVYCRYTTWPGNYCVSSKPMLILAWDLFY